MSVPNFRCIPPSPVEIYRGKLYLWFKCTRDFVCKIVVHVNKTESSKRKSEWIWMHAYILFLFFCVVYDCVVLGVVLNLKVMSGH